MDKSAKIFPIFLSRFSFVELFLNLRLIVMYLGLSDLIVQDFDWFCEFFN